MKKKLPISVIIPCYNSEKTIIRAVESVANQLFHPFEVILIDDASSNSKEAVKYLNEAKRVLIKEKISVKIIFNTINKGPAETRNNGWKQATQTYIAFLDSDDSWSCDKLGIQYNFMETNKHLDLTCHDTFYTHSITDKNTINKKQVSRLINFFELFVKNKIQTRTVMIRKSINERFNPVIRYSEDLDLWLRVIKNHKKIFYIDKKLAFCYKKLRSDEGLSGHFFKFWKSEINVLIKNGMQNLSTLCLLPLIIIFSFLKFLIRLFGFKNF